MKCLLHCGTIALSHISAAGLELWTELGLQVFYLYRLHVSGAGEAGSPGDLGERFLIGRREVDHDEDPVRPIWAGAGVALCVPGQGGEELCAALCVLEVQSDDVGQAQLAAGTPAVDQTDQESQQEDGDEREDNVDHQLRLSVLPQVQTIPVVALEINKEDLI